MVEGSNEPLSSDAKATPTLVPGLPSRAKPPAQRTKPASTPQPPVKFAAHKAPALAAGSSRGFAASDFPLDDDFKEF
jgi:hypothetical protein